MESHARAGSGGRGGSGARGGRMGGKSGTSPLLMAGIVVLVALMIVAGLALLVGGASVGSIGKGCVGVMTIDGEIVAQDTPDSLLSSGQAGSETIARQIEDANSRPEVKALVVVVNSPGGSVVASREIYEALKAYDKPKVAYFREVAASGGYYLSMGTDYIVSDPDAITGSIGAEATFTDLSGLMGKLGVNQSEIKSGALKDIGIPSRPMSEEEKALLQGVVDQLFGEFRDTVNASRGSRLNQTAFAKVLDARILTGRQAQAVGLVDALGSKKDAVAKAGAMAGDKDMPVCDLDNHPSNLLGRLLGGALAPFMPSAGSGGWRLSY